MKPYLIITQWATLGSNLFWYQHHENCGFVFKKEVQEWCDQHIGPYEVEYINARDIESHHDFPELTVQFETEEDLMLFKLRWFGND